VNDTPNYSELDEAAWLDDAEYAAYVEACAADCSCCGVCSPGSMPCEGCLAGGVCDRIACRCYDEDDA
jgi:hypothetical protein